MLSAFITHPDCARHEMDAGHPECPERLAAIQDHLLIKGLLDYMVPHDAPLATPLQLQRVHTQAHVQNLMRAAPAEGLFRVDPDTCMSPFRIPAARRAAGAAVLGTDLVMTGEEAVGPNMVNVGMPPRTGGDVLRAAVTTQWLQALEAFKPQLIFISAGFDAHREDDMGNLGLVEGDCEWLTQQLLAVAQRHAQGHIASCLEGGYVLSPLARSVAAHVKVLIGAD
jgi:acetoin utilization deacetylase AcuC-like enzyme